MLETAILSEKDRKYIANRYTILNRAIRAEGMTIDYFANNSTPQEIRAVYARLYKVKFSIESTLKKIDPIISTPYFQFFFLNKYRPSPKPYEGETISGNEFIFNGQVSFAFREWNYVLSDGGEFAGVPLLHEIDEESELYKFLDSRQSWGSIKVDTEFTSDEVFYIQDLLGIKNHMYLPGDAAYQLEALQACCDRILSVIEPKQKKPKSSEQTQRFLEAYSTILQNNVTNNLARVKTRTKAPDVKIDDISGTATIQQGNVTITIENFSQVEGYGITTQQLLDLLIQKITKENSGPDVEIPLDAFMEKRNLRDKKGARKQIKADLDVIYNTSLKFVETFKGKEEDFRDLRIIGYKGIVNSVIQVSFTTKFYNFIKDNGFPSYWPDRLFTIDGHKNPYSYNLLRKITEHKNMNIGKSNEDLIAVKTLLEAIPDMPSKETVMRTDRAYKRRIIDPFERDLEAVEDTISWEYCHSNGEPLTESELNGMNYDVFESLLIKVHWRYYPDQTKRLQQKAIKEQARKQKRKPRKKKEA